MRGLAVVALLFHASLLVSGCCEKGVRNIARAATDSDKSCCQSCDSGYKLVPPPENDSPDPGAQDASGRICVKNSCGEPCKTPWKDTRSTITSTGKNYRIDSKDYIFGSECWSDCSVDNSLVRDWMAAIAGTSHISPERQSFLKATCETSNDLVHEITTLLHETMPGILLGMDSTVQIEKTSQEDRYQDSHNKTLYAETGFSVNSNPEGTVFPIQFRVEFSNAAYSPAPTGAPTNVPTGAYATAGGTATIGGSGTGTSATGGGATTTGGGSTATGGGGTTTTGGGTMTTGGSSTTAASTTGGGTTTTGGSSTTGLSTTTGGSSTAGAPSTTGGGATTTGGGSTATGGGGTTTTGGGTMTTGAPTAAPTDYNSRVVCEWFYKVTFTVPGNVSQPKCDDTSHNNTGRGKMCEPLILFGIFPPNPLTEMSPIPEKCTEANLGVDSAVRNVLNTYRFNKAKKILDGTTCAPTAAPTGGGTTTTGGGTTTTGGSSTTSTSTTGGGSTTAGGGSTTGLSTTTGGSSTTGMSTTGGGSTTTGGGSTATGGGGTTTTGGGTMATGGSSTTAAGTTGGGTTTTEGGTMEAPPTPGTEDRRFLFLPQLEEGEGMQEVVHSGTGAPTVAPTPCASSIANLACPTGYVSTGSTKEDFEVGGVCVTVRTKRCKCGTKASSNSTKCGCEATVLAMDPNSGQITRWKTVSTGMYTSAFDAYCHTNPANANNEAAVVLQFKSKYQSYLSSRSSEVKSLFLDGEIMC